ncbi:DUF3892 domain-containing protein [Algoriphagus halophytocola]|uniref:DUF3892 domain-containing protein n=1 Tax=Algoriphagus halophytocola TaxID=2991499 RepID=A0ABY6MGH1_9BACT|nr:MULTISPECIES: DUF3892 domain-containing protein [unclassified Algoriphagus]UZD22905.1 DUF3892 domain-containing protein [Algoriphagus sp. TR-M5]WBL44173.1 DUF3892 domain-containing protein [Algoriphagus sp. TR-M9]
MIRKLIVRFIQTDSPANNTSKILKIGGINNTGDRWIISSKEAIKGVIAGDYELFIQVDNKEIPVKVEVNEDQEQYLNAHGAGYLHNLLEDLPEVSTSLSSS